MKLGDRIQLHLKEGAVYLDHGLFPEAMQRYKEALSLLGKAPNTETKKKLTAQIADRIKTLKSEVARVSQLEKSSELTDGQQRAVQDDVGNSAAPRGDDAAFQIAATLMGFGQFNKALSAFNNLLQIPKYRNSASKNILRCLMAVGSTELAVRQYHQWLESELFTEADLHKIRIFLEGILQRKGSDEKLARPTTWRLSEYGSTDDEALFDVMAVVLPEFAESESGHAPSFDVTGQSGGLVSLIVPVEEKAVVAQMKPGARLQGVNFYTPDAMFIDDCVVSSRLRLDEGPRNGDFSVTLRLLNG
jgi:hypothetical protein